VFEMRARVFYDSGGFREGGHAPFVSCGDRCGIHCHANADCEGG
jgi:hypothetical protein